MGVEMKPLSSHFSKSSPKVGLEDHFLEQSKYGWSSSYEVSSELDILAFTFLGGPSCIKLIPIQHHIIFHCLLLL